MASSELLHCQPYRMDSLRGITSVELFCSKWHEAELDFTFGFWLVAILLHACQFFFY
jgi:hypothetical protein